jgi:membrane protein required for colicin V production
MIDFVLGLALAAMLVRGWMRGMVRELFDLVGLVLGIWIAFRLSVPFGEFLSASFNLEPEVGRIGGGVILFLLLGMLLSVAAHYLTKLMNLPGLSLINRAGGAAVAIGWGILLVLVMLSVLTVFPVPDTWRAQIRGSSVAQAIAGDDAAPRQAFESLAGDDVMAAVSSIRDLFGTARAVPVDDEVYEIPPAGAEEVQLAGDEAEAVLEQLNEHRVGVGVGAVAAIPVITELAEQHAMARYRDGQIRRIGDCAADLAARTYPVVRCDNGVALAGTAAGGLEGILATSEGAAIVEAADFDRAGIGVVDGPTGRLVVVILAG